MYPSVREYCSCIFVSPSQGHYALQPKFNWGRLSCKWEYIIWPSRARTHRRADGGRSNRIRWGAKLLLDVPWGRLSHRCQGLKAPTHTFWYICYMPTRSHPFFNPQLPITFHLLFWPSPYLSFISSALVHPVNMRVSQLAVLIAASAASVSAVPTDYGNYGKYPSMCSSSQPSSWEASLTDA